MADVRRWTVLGPEVELQDGSVVRLGVDPTELAQRAEDAITVLRSIGGALTVACDRAPDPLVPGDLVTTAVQIRWHSRTDTRQTPEEPAGLILAEITPETPQPVEEPVDDPVDEPDETVELPGPPEELAPPHGDAGLPFQAEPVAAG